MIDETLFQSLGCQDNRLWKKPVWLKNRQKVYYIKQPKICQPDLYEKKKHNTVGIKNLQRYNENSFYSVGKVVSLFDTNLLELLYIHGDIMTPGNN